jgi:hypothetical protein
MADNHEPARVQIVDIKMPLSSMVVFMVKWAIAAIPAVLILFVVSAVFAGFLGGLGHGFGH